MLTAARKTLLACGAVALLGGGLAGMGLANYAQSGAFDFYKQTPPPMTGSDFAAADSAGYYPISRAAATPLYPENPAPPRVTIARAAEPADYQRAARIEAEVPPPPPIEDVALPEDPAPMIAPQRGSWTAPEESTPAPAEAVTGEVTS